MKPRYKHTLIASYIGYIVQALIINLLPLLFASFTNDFGLSVTKISFLIMLNFSIQLTVDLIAAKYVDIIGYKRGAIIAHFLAFFGLFLLSFLPFVIDPFIGICICLIPMALGGGMTEVIISPIVQSLPLENKASHMSILHSFFCWGTVLTVLLSTAFFSLFGVENWRFLAILWSLLPLFNAFYYMFVPFAPLSEDKKTTSSKTLLASRTFLIMLTLMLCSGAAEMTMSQWASYFAENGLSVSKTTGDLLGPCSFSILMGLARVLFAKFEKQINLKRGLIISSALCIISYLVASLSPYPVLSLIGCSLCGLSCGIMWPGTLSFAAEKFENAGGNMFALLAFAGDIGCTLGPFLLGLLSDVTGDLKKGLLFVIIFPSVMLISTMKIKNHRR